MQADKLRRPVLLQAPFPWFGGKSKVAPVVWERFGDVRNYVEPFMGSLAMLLGRPTPFEGAETVNDADGFVCNFWRATQHDPETVARYADWPVNENDLHARHAWIVERRASLSARLEGDPDYFDAKVAGWWVWGQCCWIGSGWCSGQGPWHVEEVDGEKRLVKTSSDGSGVNRNLPQLGNRGCGVNRQRPHLGDMGQGVHRKCPHASNQGRGVHRTAVSLAEWFHSLSERLRRVRVCCGDWSRVCGGKSGDALSALCRGRQSCGIFLDPPYGAADNREPDCYAVDSLSVADAVRDWCLRHGGDSRLRIALCGYDSFDMPGWTAYRWKANGGYANQSKSGRGRANAKRETIWFSPHCLPAPANVPEKNAA